MTTVAIMQPTYLPWCGYFDLIDQADVFVLLDTVPIDRKSWQTRNRIRARDGNVVWLSVPTHASRGQHIESVDVVDTEGWQARHERALTSAYEHAPQWSSVGRLLHMLSDQWTWQRLAGLNRTFVDVVCAELGITTLRLSSSQMDGVRSDPIERIADICAAVGATELLNTPGARDFLEGHDVGVPVRWHEYEHPVYDQGGAPFVSHLSVVDLLAWTGPDALEVIRSGRPTQRA